MDRTCFLFVAGDNSEIFALLMESCGSNARKSPEYLSLSRFCCDFCRCFPPDY